METACQTLKSSSVLPSSGGTRCNPGGDLYLAGLICVYEHEPLFLPCLLILYTCLHFTLSNIFISHLEFSCL